MHRQPAVTDEEDDTVLKVSRARNVARGVVSILVTLAMVLVGVVVAALPAAAATGTFSLAPIVGVRTTGTDACSVGPISGTNCPVTIVLSGTGLPTVDPSTIGVEESGDSASVAIVDNNDGGSGWQAGHLTDNFTTCKVIVGFSTDSTLILQVGDLGPTCPGYSVQPGDSVQVILYNSDGSTFDTETATATTPDPNATPLVTDVNPPYGPVGGGTNAAPGTGSVTITSSGISTPEAVWFGDVATNAITPVDATHYSVVPPASVPASQGNEGISVQLADQANGMNPEHCAVLLPTGCPDQFMYLSDHSTSFGPTPALNLNFAYQVGGTTAAGSKACGTNGSSGTSTALSIGASITGGGLGFSADYGISESAIGFPEGLIGSATLTVASPIVVTMSLSGSISACEQIPIPDLSIPDVAGFYVVVGGSLQGSATLTITIKQGTYTLSGGYIPGSNADDIRGTTMTSTCFEADGTTPATDCVTTAIGASLTGTLTVAPLWLQVGPPEANVGAGLVASAIGTITYPPLNVDGDICVSGNWVAQVNLGPLSGFTGGNWLGPFNIVGDGSICPMGQTVNGGSSAPDAPVSLAATPGDASATLNWSAPASDGGSPITGYNVYEGTSPGGESTTPVNASPLPATPTSFPVTGLTNGTTYYFTVTAVNAIGEGVASNEAPATPTAAGTVPDAPTALAATPADGSATLNWSAPASDGGSPITGYNVYEGTTAGGESTTPVNATPLAADASTFDVTGLTNGTTYFFTVTAVNGIGEGAASNEAPATPNAAATAPGAPVSLTASPGDSSATLNWSPPVSDGGSPITGYNVYEGTTSGGEDPTPVNASPLAADASTFDATGLTNGTTYFFTVKAINAIAEGDASNEASATPSASATIPGAPVSLSATPGDSAATLNWSPPASDGGSAITGYNVYEGTSPGGEGTTPVNASPLAADAASFDVPGLTNGTTYYFTVTAINGIGEGAASNEASATPSGSATAPGAPVGLAATPGDASATLDWSAPASDGGSPVTGYNVYEGTSLGGEGATPVNASPLPASATSFPVTGLTDGTTYYFTVKAVNAIAEGNASNEAPATPSALAGPPGAPQGLTAAPGNTTAALNWSPPAADGGSPITGYNVYEGTSPGGEALTPINASPLPATASSFDATGLTNGSTYYFTVTAINAIGEGSASNEASATPGTAATVPGVATGVVCTPGNTTVTLNWTAPASDGGSAITGYNVYLGTTPGGESSTPVNASPLPATATSFPVTGLTNGTTYYLTVTAINGIGEGAPSSEVSTTPVSAPTAPDAPIGLTATPGKASATLNWTAPASDGGSAITGYNVYEGTTPGGESATPVNTSPLLATASSFAVPGLTNGTTYYFTVTAINGVGGSDPSNEASATPSAVPLPDGPINLQAIAVRLKVTLTWTAPAADHRSGITGYNVYVGTRSGGESATPVNASPLSAGARRYNVTALTGGTIYYFVVKAVNADGSGEASNEASATPLSAPTAPGTPTHVAAVAGKTKVMLTWVTPHCDGDNPITGYDVYVGTKRGGEGSTPVNVSPISALMTRYSVTALETGTKYYFRVRAINAIGMGPLSSEVSATTGGTSSSLALRFAASGGRMY